MPARMMRVAVLAAIAGCASGTTNAISDAPVGQGTPDSMVYLDAPNIEQTPDAPVMHPDAPPVLVDAAVMPDACVPHTTELLANPAFDLTPTGTGWTEQDIDTAYPIVTADPGLNPQSSPNRAWMGGIAGTDEGKISVTDQLYQDIAVPAGTTQLVLTGYYAVATSETGTTVYDTGSVDLIQTNGTPIEAILPLTNTSTATNWTTLSHTFTSNVSGTTVRLRFTTTNDITNATSFYFDTLSLQATHCP